MSAGLRTKGSPVRFPVRAHAWVAGQVPSEWGEARERQQHTHVSFPLSPFLPLCVKISNIFKRNSCTTSPLSGLPPREHRFIQTQHNTLLLGATPLCNHFRARLTHLVQSETTTYRRAQNSHLKPRSLCHSFNGHKYFTLWDVP